MPAPKEDKPKSDNVADSNDKKKSDVPVPAPTKPQEDKKSEDVKEFPKVKKPEEIVPEKE